MTLSTQKIVTKPNLVTPTDIKEIRGVLNNLLYVPDDQLRPFILCELSLYIDQKLCDNSSPLKIFIVKKGILPTGFVVCQMDPDYKSYGMKCATFGWLHAHDLESGNLLIYAVVQTAKLSST